MTWYSAVALYFLFWVFCFFLMLPIGVRTAQEDGEPMVPGQASSAPVAPMIWRKLGWTTMVSALLFGLFLANWEAGWVTRADLERLIPF